MKKEAKKVLYFEGAGVTNTGTQELPNCRIRTVLQNNKNEFIYLEISSRDITKYDKKAGIFPTYKIGDHIAFVNHCFYIKDLNERADENKTGITEMRGKQTPYIKAELLKMINKYLHCSYDDIFILNDTEYRVHNKNGGYNLANKYKYMPRIEKKHAEVENLFKKWDKINLKKQYSNISYIRNSENKKAVQVLIHYNGYNDIVNIEDVTKYQFDYTFKPKPEPEKLLTFSEALKKANDHLYYRISSFNRSVAVTEFIKDLEKDFKNQFSLLSGNFVILYARNENGEIKEIPAKKSVTNWIEFELNHSTYYLQYDDNYFFEAYISIRNNEKRREVERVRIFNDIDLDILCKYNNGESVNYLKEYLYNKFLLVRKDNYNIDTVTPAKQVLYFRG